MLSRDQKRSWPDGLGINAPSAAKAAGEATEIGTFEGNRAFRPSVNSLALLSHCTPGLSPSRHSRECTPSCVTGWLAQASATMPPARMRQRLQIKLNRYRNHECTGKPSHALCKCSAPPRGRSSMRHNRDARFPPQSRVLDGVHHKLMGWIVKRQGEQGTCRAVILRGSPRMLAWGELYGTTA